MGQTAGSRSRIAAAHCGGGCARKQRGARKDSGGDASVAMCAAGATDAVGTGCACVTGDVPWPENQEKAGSGGGRIGSARTVVHDFEQPEQGSAALDAQTGLRPQRAVSSSSRGRQHCRLLREGGGQSARSIRI